MSPSHEVTENTQQFPKSALHRLQELLQKIDDRQINIFMTLGKGIQPSPWIQIFKWPLKAYLFDKKQSQLFDQLPYNTLKAISKPWCHF